MLSLDLDSAHHIGIKWTQFLKAETHKDSDMRSVMKQERLKDFMTLGCESDLTGSINLDKLVDRWAQLPKTRRIISVE